MASIPTQINGFRVYQDDHGNFRTDEMPHDHALCQCGCLKHYSISRLVDCANEPSGCNAVIADPDLCDPVEQCSDSEGFCEDCWSSRPSNC